MNNKVLAIICFISTIILAVSSSLLTANFFYSSGNEGAWGVVLIFIGLTFDAGKFIFPAITMYYYRHDKVIPAVIYAALCVVCIGISFLASQAMDMNKSNEILNETVTTSGAYQRQSEIFKTTSASIEQLRKDISSLRQNKDAEIQASVEGLKSQKSSLPRDYITEKNKIQNKINSTTAKTKSQIENEINQKEQQLRQLESSLLSTNDKFGIVGKDFKPTKGLYALAQWMNPHNPAELVGWLNTIKNFLVELLAIAFSIAFGSLVGQNNIKLPKLEIPTISTTNTHKDIDNVVTAKKIGFDAKNCQESLVHKPPLEVDVDKYKDIHEAIRLYASTVLNKLKSDNSCPGLSAIAKETNYNREKLRKAKAYLEHKDILEVNGLTTYVKDIDKLKSLVHKA